MASFWKDAILRFAQLAGDSKEERDSLIKPGLLPADRVLYYGKYL